MYLHLRKYEEAEKHFYQTLKLTKVDKESSSERNTLNIETMRLLAQTKARMFKREEAIELLDTILENDRGDIESYLQAAHLTEQFDYDKAIEYYTKALDFLEVKMKKVQEGKPEAELTEDDFVNPIYYNNVAVLYMKKEQREEANKMVTKARETLKKLRKNNPQSIRLKSISITLYFNEACQFEATGGIGEATNIYKYIIQEVPYYVDAYLRLAVLAKQRGGLAKAIEYAEKAARYQLDKKPVIPY
jgi:tetratricopeptide (TPR) repeat protein